MSNTPENPNSHPVDMDQVLRKANLDLLNLTEEEAKDLSDEDLEAMAEIREIVMPPLLLGC